MSRPASARNLTPTEELEKLEQSITLTLQEIDSNFSKAHRIVTTSILPLVERYGEQSKNVWEASKFWKQFFESSANVSLSGYEEVAPEKEAEHAEDETTRLTDNTGSEDYTCQDAEGDSAEQCSDDEPAGRREVDQSLVDDGFLTGSTPRPSGTRSARVETRFAGLDSPYEIMRREMRAEQHDAATGKRPGDGDGDDGDRDDSTQLPDQTDTPSSLATSVRDAPTPTPAKDRRGRGETKKKPLLHRVMDRTFRVQATPLKQPSPEKAANDMDRTRRMLWAESPTSSPEMSAPKLRTNLYARMSPVKLRGLATAPRTPGVSVQTPATAKRRDVFAGGGQDKGKSRQESDDEEWDSGDDDETGAMFGGMSPPKTIQFALPPSKLMQTPAREASKRIVDDILLTAGAAPEYADGSEYSPSVVKMSGNMLDDTF